MTAAYATRVLPVEAARCLCGGDAPAQPIAHGRDYEYDSSPDEFPLLRCACGVTFIQPRPAEAAMPVIYPSNYYAYNEEGGERPLVKFFRDRVERVKVRRYERLLGRTTAEIVDVGCGDGRLLDILRRFGPAGWQLSGVEIGAGAAARAAGKGFAVRGGDFEALDLGDWSGRFDLALMHHVIEHTRDPRAAVRKVATLLRPGGLFSIETPETAGWDYDLFRDRYWGGYHIPRHFYLFNAPSLQRLLMEEGFEVVSSRSILSPAFWLFSWHNWLADRTWGRRWAPYVHPQNPLAIGAAAAIDFVQLIARRQTSNLQVIARRLALEGPQIAYDESHIVGVQRRADAGLDVTRIMSRRSA